MKHVPYLDELHDFYETEVDQYLRDKVDEVDELKYMVRLSKALRTAMYKP